MFIIALFGNNPNVINRKMYKQLMVKPYNETLLDNKKGWNADTSNKKDESQFSYAE